MNALQRGEYVALRLVRRFVFNERMANRLAGWLPYYVPSVNEQQPTQIVDEYAHALADAGMSIANQRVLEVGAGRTNAVGYGLVGAGAHSATLLEPFVAFDAERDAALRRSDTRLAAVDADKINRVRSFADIASGKIDLLLSNSVLEHVREPQQFFADCRRVLAAGGTMLHRVDYRDHFFKYPYAFLTFSDRTWSRWLDPGDLPRWRLPDHLQLLAATGFHVDVLDQQASPDLFEQVRPQLTGRFAAVLPGIEVTGATLLARIPA